MALTVGTNCGFVSSAPSTDPGETAGTIDGWAIAVKDTTDADQTSVSEIGWYQANASPGTPSYNCGIYSHNAGLDRPNALVDTQQSGNSVSGEGWHKYTGLSISLSGSTTYWIGTACDNTGTAEIDYSTGATTKYKYAGSASGTLPDPWSSSTGYSREIAIYAVAAGGTTIPVFMRTYRNMRSC